jgi:lipopolysaccharide assembly protein A
VAFAWKRDRNRDCCFVVDIVGAGFSWLLRLCRAGASRQAEAGVTGPTVKTPRSRAGAVWVGICIAALLLIVLVIFMLQNTRPVLVTFFSLEGAGTSANALLIAGIGVGLIALVVGTVRIGQLRRRLSQERRS